MNYKGSAKKVSLLILGLGLAVNGYSQLFLTNGLVAYYPFNGNANDASGNGYHGTNFGAASSSDRFGNPSASYSFNGSNSYIWIGTQVRPSLLSASALFRTGVTSNSYGNQTILRDRYVGWVIGMAANAPDQNSGLLYCDLHRIGDPEFHFWVTNSAYNDGRWHMVNITYDGYTLAVYVDGVIQQSETRATYSNIHYDYEGVGGLAIGRDGDFEGSYFQGDIDNVRIYNRALSASEVQQLYNFETGPQVGLLKAVKPSFSNLTPGLKYQLQVSLDMNAWYDQGLPFSATSTNMVYPSYYDVDSWGQLFFKLRVSP